MLHISRKRWGSKQAPVCVCGGVCYPNRFKYFPGSTNIPQSWLESIKKIRGTSTPPQKKQIRPRSRFKWGSAPPPLLQPCTLLRGEGKIAHWVLGGFRPPRPDVDYNIWKSGCLLQIDLSWLVVIFTTKAYLDFVGFYILLFFQNHISCACLIILSTKTERAERKQAASYGSGAAGMPRPNGCPPRVTPH